MIWELDSSDVVTKVFDGGPDLSQTLEGAGTAGGLIRVQIDGGSGDNWVTFPCYDGNRNVVGLAGYSTGNLLAQYEYDGFGRLIRTAGDSSLAEGNPFLFSTKTMDRKTGWTYYGYRYSDPDNGRWLNRDPIGERGGGNLSGMLVNDPVNKYDILSFAEDFDIPPLSQAESTLTWPFDGCCCPEEFNISNTAEINDGLQLGRTIQFYVRLGAKNPAKDGSCGGCELDWWEKTNKPYLGSMVENQWSELDFIKPSAEPFVLWTRQTSTPGEGGGFRLSIGFRGDHRSDLFDTPLIGLLNPLLTKQVELGKPYRRQLDAYIRIVKTPGCPCEKDEIVVRFRQIINGFQPKGGGRFEPRGLELR